MPFEQNAQKAVCAGFVDNLHKDGDHGHRLLRSCPMTQTTATSGTPSGASPARTTSGPAIELRDATKRFPTKDGGTFTAIRDVTLDISAGEFVAVVGPTGCGKSTTLSLVSGLEPASAGTVRVHGAPVTGIPDGVGYMFQADAVLPWKNVLDNVALGPRYRGVRKDA